MRQKSLFPHLDGAAGARRAAISKRLQRARKCLDQSVDDLWWLAARLPQHQQDIMALIDDIEGARSQHIPDLSNLIPSAK